MINNIEKKEIISPVNTKLWNLENKIEENIIWKIRIKDLYSNLDENNINKFLWILNNIKPNKNEII